MVQGRTQVQHGHEGVSVGALADNGVVSASIAIDASRTQGVRLRQFKAAFDWFGKTTDQGPLLVGLSTDLSTTEISECLQADPQHINDVPSTEEANRKVFPLFIVGAESTAGNYPGHSDEASSLIDMNFPWREITEGQGIQFWVQNLSGGTLTTGMTLFMIWTAVQDWLKD